MSAFKNHLFTDPFTYDRSVARTTRSIMQSAFFVLICFAYQGFDHTQWKNSELRKYADAYRVGI